MLLAPPTVVECIKQGYRLPLKHLPPFSVHQNHSSTWNTGTLLSVCSLLSACNDPGIGSTTLSPDANAPKQMVAHIKRKDNLIFYCNYTFNYTSEGFISISTCNYQQQIWSAKIKLHHTYMITSLHVHLLASWYQGLSSDYFRNLFSCWYTNRLLF